ncbi:hypothetical protein [Sodalis glossinidius]|uniref:hypothetical protein n=1 Tax=Sodalis glossinidius TaxID=63612 RepID=UPI0002D837BA|nr:hypothetical protein [Sodalis glossinidius]
MRAGGDVTLTAKRIDMMGDSQLVAGSDAQGQLTRTGTLMMTSQGPLLEQGANQATGALMVWGSEVDLAGSRTSGTDIMLSANRGAITTNGAEMSGGKITARAATFLSNNNGRLSANALKLMVHEISNRLGTLQQRGEHLLQLKVQQMNNHQGMVLNNGDTRIKAAWLENRAGRIIVPGANLSLQTKILDNQEGTIKLLGSGKMTVVAERFNGYQGILWSAGAMTLAGEQLELSQSVTRAQ